MQTQLPIFAPQGEHLRTGDGQFKLIAFIITTIIAILVLLKPTATPPATPAPPVVVNVQTISEDEVRAIFEQAMHDHDRLDQPPNSPATRRSNQER